MEFTDKVAFITGGASGIGKATALLLAREGAKVAVFDRAQDREEQLLKQVARYGGEAMAISGDVSAPADMEKAVHAVLDRWERLDIVFANAGINGVWAPLEEITPEEWDMTLAVNLRGTFLTVKYAVPALRRRGGAVIITSSINGTHIFSNTGATAYSCSKAAQVAFARMTAVELAKDNIRVNVICPGGIRTNIGENTEARHLDEVRFPVIYPEGNIPLPEGIGWPEQVAHLVRFLASDVSRHISGAVITIDGAESLVQG